MPALKSDFVLYLMDDCGEKRLARGAAKCGRVSPYVVGPGLRSVPTISRSSDLILRKTKPALKNTVQRLLEPGHCPLDVSQFVQAE